MQVAHSTNYHLVVQQLFNSLRSFRNAFKCSFLLFNPPSSLPSAFAPSSFPFPFSLPSHSLLPPSSFPFPFSFPFHHFQITKKRGKKKSTGKLARQSGRVRGAHSKGGAQTSQRANRKSHPRDNREL